MNVYYFNTLLQILLGLNRQTVIGRAAFKKVKQWWTKNLNQSFLFLLLDLLLDYLRKLLLGELEGVDTLLQQLAVSSH